MKSFLFVLLIVALAACGTAPPPIHDAAATASEVDTAEEATAEHQPQRRMASGERFHLDPDPAGEHGFAVALLIGIGEEVRVPARMTYEIASSEEWSQGLMRLIGALSSGDASESPDQGIMLGPDLTARVKGAGLCEQHVPHWVMMQAELKGEMHVLECALYTREDKPEGFEAMFNVIRNELTDAYILQIRRATFDELDWYWSVIGWDVQEPLFVIETEEHDFFIDFNIMDMGVMYVDDYRELEWRAE